MAKSQKSKTPEPKQVRLKRPASKPKLLWRLTPIEGRTAWGRFFTWLRTPEHKWEFGIKVVTLVVAVVGTWLLINQNGLLKSQNALIQQQMSLEEASRRSALVMLMSNIMDKVDDEIKEQKSEFLRKGVSRAVVDTMKYSLSQSLIGQIAALSHSFKPYRYMSGDSLISKRSSPERGQLLITIIKLPLDTITIQRIYKSANFQESDLNAAILYNADLRGIDLSESDLSDSHLENALLNGANLFNADLSYAHLNGTILNEANLNRADLSFAYLEGAKLLGTGLNDTVDLSNAFLPKANFTGAYLIGAYLKDADLTKDTFRDACLFWANMSGANLSGADLSNAELQGVNFSEADLSETNISISQASQVLTFYKCNGIHDSVKLRLLKSHPHLFKRN